MLKRLLFSVALMALTSAVSFADEADYKVDDRGNVVFSTIVEGLPLSKAEIYNAAKSYLENAYKDTKYTISTDNEANGMVIGDGFIASFFEHGSAITMTSVNLGFKLRVDAMDNRARVQFIAREYELLKLKDLGDKETIKVLISEVQPIGSETKDKGMYKKAFTELQGLSSRTLSQMVEALKSAEPTPTSDDW